MDIFWIIVAIIVGLVLLQYILWFANMIASILLMVIVYFFYAIRRLLLPLITFAVLRPITDDALLSFGGAVLVFVLQEKWLDKKRKEDQNNNAFAFASTVEDATLAMEQPEQEKLTYKRKKKTVRVQRRKKE